MIHSSGYVDPGNRAMTLLARLRPQSNASLRCARAVLGPKRYVIGSAPRHSAGTTGPLSAMSSGCASPYEIGRTGIFVNVVTALMSRRLAEGVAPTFGVSGSPG